jgi:N-acetylmuramoyl-L-alanine amidase
MNRNENNKRHVSWAELVQLYKNCHIQWRTLYSQGYTYGIIAARETTEKIIVHCTATPQGRNYSMEDIRQMHLKRGFLDIGYHYVILRDGTICEGRSETLVGAHCKGYNETSVGIAYVGGVDHSGRYPLDTRTIQQRDALRRLLCLLHALYPEATLHGHREFAKKACPSFDVHADYGEIFGEEKVIVKS